jgi:hypothetical protein
MNDRDDAVARTFPYQIIMNDNNTATNCLSLCSEFGYGAGGMEYGYECCTPPHPNNPNPPFY